jgi:hypothetical protein|tara:strand:+ start:8065 stop:8271 length:207 start_codon:yes stop_codon:yes gene_type:complete
VKGSAPSIPHEIKTHQKSFSPPTGAAAHGENKAAMCDTLFKAYKACRKQEHAEIVRQRRENRKGMFWD